MAAPRVRNRTAACRQSRKGVNESRARARSKRLFRRELSAERFFISALTTALLSKNPTVINIMKMMGTLYVVFPG